MPSLYSRFPHQREVVHHPNSDETLNERDEHRSESVTWHPANRVTQLFCEMEQKIAPAENCDIYKDCLYAPLFLRFRRLQQHDECGTCLSDYFGVTTFLLITVVLQLSIGYKVFEIADQQYGGYANTLFGQTCWKTSGEQRGYYDAVLPHSLQKDGDYDCLFSALVIAQTPEMLDLNADGLWSIDEARQTQQKMHASRLTHLEYTLERMREFDKKAGNIHADGNLNITFFAQHAGQLKICLLMDPALCGNFERAGYLKRFSMSRFESGRILDCREIISNFCVQVFGEPYYYLLLRATSESLCGEPKYEFDSGVSVVTYSKVGLYVGEESSIVGVSFASFLAILLFVWSMLIWAEYRQIIHHVCVIWSVPSTASKDDDFAFISVHGKMQIKALPFSHKIYSLFVVCLSRGIITTMLLYAGIRLLSMSNSLMHLLLNGTSLSFVLETDEMVHIAFYGNSWTCAILRKCEALSARYPTSGVNVRPCFRLIGMIGLIFAWMMYLYNSQQGFREIAKATQCLCHLSGPCLAKRLLDADL